MSVYFKKEGNMQPIYRKLSFFEYLLLAIGAFIIILGSFLLTIFIQRSIPLFEIMVFVMMWLILIVVIIISAIAESAREDLGIIIQENNKEIKLLRDISKEHLDEIKLLRQTIGKR
jgi:hypothetical protein